MAQLTLENLRGIHTGRPAIIAGAGPSLRHLAPEDTGKFVMLCINRAILKYPNAQYFFTCDPGSTLLHSWYEAKKMACEFVLGVSESHGGFGAYDCRTGESHVAGISEDRIVKVARRSDGNNLKFDRSDKELIFGWTSAHCAVHLAYLMGCSPIILVGCDCGPEDGKYYYSDFPGQGQWNDYLENQAMEVYFQKPQHSALQSFLSYWNRLAEHNPTVEIINCGNAIMPNIQPEKLKDVLQKYGQ